MIVFSMYYGVQGFVF